MSNIQQKIAFIGGGNMAQALITGLLAKGQSAETLYVVDTDEQKLTEFAKQGIHTFHSDHTAQAIAEVDVAILAVKPQILKDVLLPIQSAWGEQLVISIVAGIGTNSLRAWLGDHVKIVRAMPNTPAMILQGATGLFATEQVNELQQQQAEQILTATGVVIWVNDEQLLHAVTAISGSAPAYFFYLLENMIKTGEQLGLTHEQASILAMQTAIGSANMASQSTDTPAQLRQKVTSPNGTTQSAIQVMDDHRMNDIIQQAMQACVHRSQEISQTFGD